MASYPLRGSRGWDVPLKQYVEASFAPIVDVYATPSNFPGLDPTGSTDCTGAMQAAFDATPNLGRLIVPSGRYRVAGLTTLGKSVVLDMRGATFVQASNAAILRLKGGFETLVGATVADEVRTVDSQSRRQVKITFPSSVPAGWAKGDIVKIVSDDVIPEARPGSGGSESRRGEFGTVFEISDRVVYLSGPLRDTYTTNVRVARLPNRSVRVVGWRSETPTNGMAWTKQHLAVEAFVNPVVEGADVPQGAAQALTFTGCYGGVVDKPNIGYLVDSAGTAQYGYGIHECSCQGLTVVAPVIRNVRHAFSDDTQRIAAGHSDAGLYGPSRYAEVIGGKAYGTNGSAWDTHAAGEGHRFTNCQAIGCANGFALRGRSHKVINGFAQGCAVAYWVHDEGSGDLSYGHELLNCYGIDARLDAIKVEATTHVPGRSALRVSGGLFTSDLRGFDAARADCAIDGFARFVTKPGALASGSVLMRATSCTITLNALTVDATPTTTGSNLAFFSAANTAARFVGKRVDCLVPAGSPGTRPFPFPFIGSGSYTLRDVDLNYDPTLVGGPGRIMPPPGVGSPAVGSRIAWYDPNHPDGTNLTQ